MKISRKEIEARKKIIVKAFLKNAGNVNKLCSIANITRKTYYEWMNTDEEFRQQIEEENEALLDYTESKHFENIMAGKETSIIFTLKTKGKARGWVEQQHIHHSGTTQQLTGVTVEIVHTERNAQERSKER